MQQNTTEKTVLSNEDSKIICIEKTLLLNAVQTAQDAVNFILENASGEDFEKQCKVKKLMDQLSEIQLKITLLEIQPVVIELPAPEKTLFDW